MKKHFIFGVITLFVFSFLTCDHEFAFPKEIQIKGSPDIKFGATVDLGGMFKDAINNLGDVFTDSGFKLIECTNTQTETIMLYQLIFGEKFDLSDSNLGNGFPPEVPDDFLQFLIDLGIDIGSVGVVEYPLEEEKVLLEGSFPLDLSGIDSNILGGFAFENARILLYVSGEGGLAELLWIDIDSEPKPVSSGNASNFAAWESNGYNGTNYPSGSAVNIELSSLTSESNDLTYRIYIPEDTMINPALLKLEAEIKVEAVIWFPLELTVTDSALASIEIMKSIMEEGDLFGRSVDPEESENNLDLENFVTWLKLDLILNNKLFEGASVVAKSGDVNIEMPLTGNSITLDINKDKLNEINNPDNIPFNPSINLAFDDGAKLTIPRGFDIAITKFGISAGLNVKIPLPWASEE